MIKLLKKLLKKMGFHHCQYEKIGFRQVEDDYERHSIRLYRCNICGHEKWVDGRRDTING